MIDRPGPRPSEEFKRLYTAVIQDAKRDVLPCHSDAFAKLVKHCEETGEVPRSLCVFIDVRAQKVTPVYAELTLYDQGHYIEMYPKHKWIESVVNTHPVHDRNNDVVENVYYEKYGELRIAAPSNGYDFLFSAHAPFPGGFKLPPSQLMYSNAILCRTCKVANGVGEEWGITLPYSETQVKYIVDNMKFYPDRLSWAMASKSEPAITLYSPPEEGAWDIPGGEDDGTW